MRPALFDAFRKRRTRRIETELAEASPFLRVKRQVACQLRRHDFLITKAVLQGLPGAFGGGCIPAFLRGNDLDWL